MNEIRKQCVKMSRDRKQNVVETAFFYILIDIERLKQNNIVNNHIAVVLCVPILRSYETHLLRQWTIHVEDCLLEMIRGQMKRT